MRLGIAMIELIFSIVILGIVLMSAPMLISTAAKSGYVSLQQEAIASTAAEIGMILTQHWDEGDTNATRSAPILGTNGDTELNEPNISGLPSGRMAGTPDSSKRSFVDSQGGRINSVSVANLGSDGGDTDDIDDFTGNGLTDYAAANTTEGDVTDTDISMAVTVSYISDAANYAGTSTLTLSNPFNTAAAGGGTSNIKHVNVTLTTTNTNIELSKNISLNAFSCNIGTYELNRRTLP